MGKTKIFLQKCQKAKNDYVENIVNDLKSSDVSQWYSKIKRMSSHFKENEDDSEVQDMIGMSNKDQAEQIADQFAEISQIYEPLEKKNINLDNVFDERPLLI